VANLARLELTASEKVRFAKDLSEVIAFADKLGTYDLENLEPKVFTLEGFNVFRADEAERSLSVEEALKNAPVKADGLFFVPKTVE